MNDKIQQKTNRNTRGISAKDCAYIAVFVALTIAAQLALSVLPGVEVVTVLFISFSFVFGIKRGVIAATAFTLLRQFVFGVFPVVLVLYLIYFNLLACIFGTLGKKIRKRWGFRQTIKPPSAVRTWPVMKEALSEARKATA